MGGTLSRRAKALRFSLLQHSGQVAEWSKARAWRAGKRTTKLETEFTLFTEDCTILPPIVNCSLYIKKIRGNGNLIRILIENFVYRKLGWISSFQMLALTISNQRSRMDLLLPTNRIPNKAHAHGQQKAPLRSVFCCR